MKGLIEGQAHSLFQSNRRKLTLSHFWLNSIFTVVGIVMMMLLKDWLRNKLTHCSNQMEENFHFHTFTLLIKQYLHSSWNCNDNVIKGLIEERTHSLFQSNGSKLSLSSFHVHTFTLLIKQYPYSGWNCNDNVIERIDWLFLSYLTFQFSILLFLLKPEAAVSIQLELKGKL